MDPLIGKTVNGTYRVEELIGRGGMGRVYRATQLALDLPVAMKVLRRELVDAPSLAQRFEREARALSRLRHANVISVTDFGQTEDGSPFMIMELVAGRSLEHVVGAEAPIPEPRAVRIAAQILAALAEAHAAGILHRDLKPANVMLEVRRDEPDFVKVIDFGIAKIQAPDDGGGTLTQEGLICGTPSYMSPEQWNGEELDARTDLYAVGVMLYEMLAGRKPYQATTPMALMRELLDARLAPPSQWRSGGAGLSAGIEALVLQALSFEREDRPRSAEAMRSALLSCAGGAAGAGAQALEERPTRDLPAPPAAAARGVDPALEIAPTAFRPAPRRGSRAALAAAAVAAGVVALGAAALLRKLAPAPIPPPRSAAPLPAAEPSPPAGAADAAAEPSDAGAAVLGEPGAGGAAADASAPAGPPPAPPPPPAPLKAASRRRGVIAVRDVLRGLPMPPSSSGEGILSIQAEPYGDVYLDERPYGTAPREFRVTAGSYQVRVVHAKFGQRVKLLEVRPGRRVDWTADFLSKP